MTPMRSLRSRIGAEPNDDLAPLDHATASLATAPADTPMDSPMFSAVRDASAMMVIIGLVPDGVGNAEASPIQTPGVSCSSPRGSATLVAGSMPIRQVPIW